MSEQTYNSRIGGAKNTDNNSGLLGLESRIDMAEQEISAIHENLMQMLARLYPPHPTPAATVNDGSKTPSIENGLNRLISHLQELRRLSSALLNG